MSSEIDPNALRAGLDNVVPLSKASLPLEAVESSWRPQRLSNDLPPSDPPSVLRVGVSKHLLYRGRTHTVIGESSSGKTWLAVLASVEVLRAGGRVLWIDYETNGAEVANRHKSMSDIPDEYWTRFDYVSPTERLEDSKTNASTIHGAVLYAHLETTSYDLVVIDSVTGAMSCEGLDTNSDADVETFHRLLAYRLANSGPAVLMLDHVVKSTENRGNDARGSGRKREGVTGASYKMKVNRPWKRATGGTPVMGSFTLTVAKDRDGQIGAIGDDVATGVVTADPDGGLRIHLTLPEDTVVPPSPKLLDQILDHLRTFGPMSGNQLGKALGGNEGQRRDAVAWLLHEGGLIRDGYRLVPDEDALRRLDLG